MSRGYVYPRRRPLVTEPGPGMFTATSDDAQAVMAAWLVVLGRVGVGDVRLLSILALPDFAGRACIHCVPCAERDGQGGFRHMRVTELVRHLARTASESHVLQLNPDAFIPLP